MRVAIDVSPLLQTRAGTARYLKGLLRELERSDDVDVRLRSFGRRDRLSTLARDTVWYPFALGRERSADVLHCPTYRGPLRPARPLVVTVHDLAVFRHPGTFNRWTRAYSPRLVPHVLAAARRIIAVSDFTKRELVEVLDLPPDKIRVVPNAVEDEFTSDGPAAEGGRTADRRRARLGRRDGRRERGPLAGRGERRRAGAALPRRTLCRLPV